MNTGDKKLVDGWSTYYAAGLSVTKQIIVSLEDNLKIGKSLYERVCSKTN